MQRATGALSTAAVSRMSSDLAWFDDLSAQHRSWVGLIVQAGVKGFIDWYAADADPTRTADTPPLAAAVFGAAPRELTGVINLQQTVDLVRLSIAAVEADIDEFLDPADTAGVHRSILRYGREVAFATAQVYARAAELRGAWDARLEALVVDAILRDEPDETVLPRASALGWDTAEGVCVVLGGAPVQRAGTDLFEEVRRSARAHGLDALCATEVERMVVVLGGVQDPLAAARHVADHFAPGPVVVGPVTGGLSQAHASARAATSAYRSAAGWPDAPRPALSDDLVPERALGGDQEAQRHLVEDVYRPLLERRGTLLDTLAAYFEHGASIEATARHLFVHANTVRYRLRQVGDVTGLAPSVPRDAFTLQIALVLGRQATSERL